MKKWGIEVPEEWISEELIFYVNGEWVKEGEAKVSVMDQVIVHGVSVFEGVRAYNGSYFKLDEHIDRLERSAQSLGMDLPITRRKLKKICKKFLEINNLKDAHIRIIITPGLCYGWPEGAKGPTIMVFGLPWKRMFGAGREGGIRVITSPYRRIPPECFDPRIKTTTYLPNYLSHLHAILAGVDDALVLDIRGFVSEMPGSNIFIVKNNSLYTPKKYFVLEGITRETIIDLAKEKGYTLAEEDLTLYDVYNADEAFACGSAAEITPIVEVDGRKIGEGEPGPVTKRIQQAYFELTHTSRRHHILQKSSE